MPDKKIYTYINKKVYDKGHATFLRYLIYKTEYFSTFNFLSKSL